MRQHPSVYIVFAVAAAVFAFVSPCPAQEDVPEGIYSEYLVGSYFLENGDVVQAVERFERAWRLSEHDPTVGLKLAESYYLLKNFTRCELVIDDVLESAPGQTDALMMKAKVRYIQRDARSAVDYLERVRQTHPSSFEVERLLGNIYYEMGESKLALEAYQRCLSIDSTFPYIQYRYGRLLALDGQVGAAEAAFREAMSLDPSFVEPALALIDLLIGAGRSAEALPHLEEIVEKDPRNESAMISLAGIYLETKQYDEGLALVERWKEHSPLSPEAEILLARLYFEKGDLDGARAVFTRLFEANAGSAELGRILGEVCLKSGDTGAARDYFERAIAADTDDYRSYLALFFASSPRFSRAAGSEHVITLSDDAKTGLLTSASAHAPAADFEANYLVGVSLLSMDMLAEAESHFRRAHELKDGDFDTMFNLATVYEKQRRYEEAEPYLQTMLGARPDDATTLNFYGYLLAEMQQDLPRALEMVEKALIAEPGNGYFLDSLGWIYYQMGDYARAVVELEKSSAIVKDDPVILEHLGDAYAAMRRFKEARSAYERSHELQGGDGDILQKIQSATREEQ